MLSEELIASILPGARSCCGCGTRLPALGGFADWAAIRPERLDALTQRERDVVALVATGLTNGEIAETLAISPHTAKTHVNRAMTKLAARDRAQLVIVAYETGLVEVGRAGPATP